MPKKTAQKKVSKSTKKKKQKSFLSKYFTFPVIAIMFFVLLSLLTVILVAKPNSNVLGVKNSVSVSR